jgi:Transglutaminase-like superfamily
MDWWKSAIASGKKFFRLSGEERSLLAQSLILLPLSAIALHCLGFRRLSIALKLLTVKNSTSVRKKWGDKYPRISETAQMVQLANRHGFYRASCLQQSLVLWGLLQNQGIESNLKIGVRKSSGKFEAHAWVEYQGYVLNDSQNVQQQFAPFADGIFPMGAKTA